jgi:hypothetical protein
MCGIRKTLICFVIFALKHLFVYGQIAEEGTNNSLSDLNKGALFVSLGSSCDVAIHLDHFGLRNAAFPFDWLLTTDGDKLIELLDHDFQYFLDDQYFSKFTTKEDLAILVNSYYHIEFRHHFHSSLWDSPTRYQNGLEELKSTFRRKIERFRLLDAYPGKVFFIRAPYFPLESLSLYWNDKAMTQIHPEWAMKLNEVLKKRFPHLDFTLVILNRNEDGIKCIENIMFCDVSTFNKTQIFHNHGTFEKIFRVLLNDTEIRDH